MDTLPRLAASTLLFKSCKVLLIKRGKEPSKGLWSLPGGGKEEGESFEDCAKRELLEETSLQALNLKHISTRKPHSRNSEGNITHQYVIETFLALQFEGEPIAGDDAVDVGWFTRDEVLNLPTTNGLIDFLNEHASDTF